MRLLVTITRYYPAIGGAEIHTRELLRHLPAEAAIQARVAAHFASNRTDWLLGTTLRAPLQAQRFQDEDRPVELIAPTGSERIREAPWVLAYYPLLPWAAPRLARTLVPHLAAFDPQPDVVHNVRAGREPLSLASLDLARRRGVPFVLTPNHHPRWTGWRYRVYLDLYRRADALIAFTEHERSVLAELGVAPERVHVTGIGPIMAPTAHPDRVRWAFDLRRPFVLFVGQKYAYKGLDTLVGAAPSIWARHPEVDIVVVGPRTTYSRRLFARSSVGQDPRLRELDSVDLQTKTDLLHAAELICLPSAQEAFGGVLVEAWAAGKPVIAGPARAIADVVDDGVDGWFLPRQSPGDLAERVLWLLDRPSTAAEFGQAGAAKVAARFTWSHLAAQTARIYDALR